MVPDLPEVVDAKPIGQLDLLQGVLQEAVLVIGPPRSWELVLVEDPESHGGPSSALLPRVTARRCCPRPSVASLRTDPSDVTGDQGPGGAGRGPPGGPPRPRSGAGRLRRSHRRGGAAWWPRRSAARRLARGCRRAARAPAGSTGCTPRPGQGTTGSSPAPPLGRPGCNGSASR